jgi:hypothetical protein
LLLANLLALPILSFPAFGFIHYMDLDGIPKFILVGWASATAAALAIWPQAARRRGLSSYALFFISAYVPVVLAYGAALHKLYFDLSAYRLWKYFEHSLLLGGLFTAGYWLPASLLNFLALRARAS